MKPPEVEVKHEATWNLSPVSMVVLNCFSTVLEVIFGSCLTRTRHHLANLADMSELKSTNIRSTFALSFFLGILEQIITGPVLVLYLYQIALDVQGPVRSVSTGPNSLVGFNQGVCGVVKLLSVAPISWLVDRDPTRRVLPLRASLFFGLATVIIGGFLLYTDQFALATVLASCCGIFIELCQSASRAILTDSIPEGKREGIFVTQWVCYLLGAASGPFLAAVAILASSGSSSASHMKLALVCGLVAVAPIASIIFTFVDPLTRESMECGPKLTNGNDRVNVSNLSVKSCTGRRVPILCVTFFVVSVFAGGLIVPFFILFFENDVHLSLIQVNLLEGCSWFFIAICSKAGAWISKHFGRAPTMLSIFILCTALTFMLRRGLPAPMLMVVFLFRRGLGNCIKPLLDSVVADFTPSTERGMWNAFLSIGIAGWSGSALLGGILADQHGYTFVIFITSVVYAGSLLLLMALVGLVSDQTDKCPTDPVKAASEDSEPSGAEGSEEVP